MTHEHGVVKPPRMNFLRQRVKSRDENEKDEAEIKRLEKKLGLLKKKMHLVLEIKKLQRSIETGEQESDEGSASPRKWKSLKWVRCETNDESFEDDVTFEEDENQSLAMKITDAMDCIQDGCSPTSIINEWVGFHTSSGVPGSADNNGDESSRGCDKSDKPKSCNLSDARAQGGETDVKNPVDDKEDIDDTIQVFSDIDEHASSWMDKATNVLRMHSFTRLDEDILVPDCFEMKMLLSKLKAKPAIEPSKEINAKFAQVTITALALSGLSIKCNGRKKQEYTDAFPPVHVILSVFAPCGKSFTQIPSMNVVRDPTRNEVRTKKSVKHHAIGLWDTSAEEESTSTGYHKSSVSFSRLAGFSTSESDVEVRVSPSMLHLRVCIKREGSEELLPIGVAKVLVSGGPREKELAIPLKPEYYKSMEELIKKLNTKPPQSKWESFKTFVMEDEDEVMSE